MYTSVHVYLANISVRVEDAVQGQFLCFFMRILKGLNSEFSFS